MLKTSDNVITTAKVLFGLSLQPYLPIKLLLKQRKLAAVELFARQVCF